MEIEIAPLGIGFILLHITATNYQFYIFLLLPLLRKAPNLSNLTVCLVLSDEKSRIGYKNSKYLHQFFHILKSLPSIYPDPAEKIHLVKICAKELSQSPNQ